MINHQKRKALIMNPKKKLLESTKQKRKVFNQNSNQYTSSIIAKNTEKFSNP
jgi:hypothetical protein